MIAKHTPKPWRVDINNRINVMGPRDEIGFPTTIVYNAGMPNDEEAKANARLIAAAPDLLEALEYAVRFLRDEDHDTAFVRAAITKAKGEST